MSRKISDIYTEYKIKRDIREHMLRVAAVASLICDNLDEKIDKELIISVCLLHDMGNIIKDQLIYYPEFLEPEGLDYWQNIRNEFIKKYGNSEDEATFLIGQEIKLNPDILELLRELVLIKLEDYTGPNTFKLQICKYADVRVSPLMVLSLKDRIEEWHKRNSNITQENALFTYNFFSGVEKQIFAKCKIKPEDITDEAVAPIIESLKDFVIK